MDSRPLHYTLPTEEEYPAVLPGRPYSTDLYDCKGTLIEEGDTLIARNCVRNDQAEVIYRKGQFFVGYGLDAPLLTEELIQSRQFEVIGSVLFVLKGEVEE